MSPGTTDGTPFRGPLCPRREAYSTVLGTRASARPCIRDFQPLGTSIWPLSFVAVNRRYPCDACPVPSPCSPIDNLCTSGQKARSISSFQCRHPPLTIGTVGEMSLRKEQEVPSRCSSHFSCARGVCCLFFVCLRCGMKTRAAIAFE